MIKSTEYFDSDEKERKNMVHRLAKQNTECDMNLLYIYIQ